MTPSLPVQRAIDLLTDAGYRRCTLPLIVATLPFKFAAAFLGAARAHDVVVLIDTLEEPESRIRQKVEGLARALDLGMSRRPLTVVLIGPPPTNVILEAIARVSRVLQVGTFNGDKTNYSMIDNLSVLLRLHLPETGSAVVNPFYELQSSAVSEIDQEILADFLAAATTSEDEVKNMFRSIMLSSLVN